MPLAVRLLALAAVVLWLAFAWVLYQVSRAARPRSPRLLAILLGLLALTMTVSFAVPLLGPVFSPVLGPSSATLVKNWLSVADFAAALAFLAYLAGVDVPRTRLLVQRLPAALALALMTAAWYAAAPTARAADYTDPDLSSAMAVYWIVGLAYLGFGSAAGSLLLIRTARLTPYRPSTVGLRVAAAGFGMILFFLSVYRIVVLAAAAAGVTAPEGLNAAALVLERIGILLLGVGLAVPAAAARVGAVRVWWRHRRLHQDMAPLWERLTAVFPGLVLDRPHRGGRLARLRPTAVHARYYRRITECRDGLVLLSPHLPADIELGDPAAEARGLERALHAHTQHDPGTATVTPGAVLADPGGSSVDDDARHLAALAARLRPART